MADEKTTETAKPEHVGELPAHLADADYVGPLTGEQAQARIAKFGYGSTRTPETKPAIKAKETK